MPLLGARHSRTTAVEKRAKTVRRATLATITTATESRPAKKKVWNIFEPRSNHDPVMIRKNWMWLQWCRITETAKELKIIAASHLDDTGLLRKDIVPDLYQEVVSIFCGAIV